MVLYIDCTEVLPSPRLSELQRTISESLEAGFELCEGHSTLIEGKHALHVSLSKPHNCERFIITSLRTELVRNLTRSVPSFTLSFDRSPVLVLNDSRRRGFISFVCKETAPLASIVDICDHVLKKYDYSPYYSKPIFHLSIASVEKQDKTAIIDQEAHQLDSSLQGALSYVDLNPIKVCSLTLRAGNTYHTIPLS